jgi:hypothetical protein
VIIIELPDKEYRLIDILVFIHLKRLNENDIHISTVSKA